MKSYPMVLISLVVFLAAFCICCKPVQAVAVADTNTPEPPVVSLAEPNSSAEAKTTDVVATVNGIDITKDEIETRIKPQLERIAAQGAKTPPQLIEQYKTQLRQQAVDGMIVELLLDEQAKANKIVVTEEDVLGHLKEMSSKQGLTLEDIKALMEAHGQSFDEVKRQIRKGLGYQKLVEAQWAGKTNITEDDAKKYYSKQKSEFETPEQVRASHILIKPDTSDPNANPNQAKSAAIAKARELLKQLKDGADFATLAKANSSCPSAAEGGDLNFFDRGRMTPAFEKAAFELKVGQVSGVVETQFGYHIIKLTDRKDAAVTAFEQAKDDIIKMLTQKKQGEVAKEYIDSLKAKANITYKADKETKEK